MPLIGADLAGQFLRLLQFLLPQFLIRINIFQPPCQFFGDFISLSDVCDKDTALVRLRVEW